MWTILKFEKKNFHNLKNDIIKRVGKDTKFYTPKLLIKIKKNNKLYNKEFTLLGDYMFCFHNNLLYIFYYNKITMVHMWCVIGFIFSSYYF